MVPPTEPNRLQDGMLREFDITANTMLVLSLYGTNASGYPMELLPEALWYRRMHQANSSMESDTRQMTTQMQEALLKVVRDSLLRRRAQDGNASRTYQFPASDWKK